MVVLDLLSMFFSVLLAEMGDKTQIATLLFAAASRHHPLLIFAAAAGALCLSSAVAVVIGQAAGHYLTQLPLKLIAGTGFILLGLWTLYGHFSA